MEKILIICGPTATGKTHLAIYLAKRFNGEIISADSRQVYQHMDIGTGKDLPKNSKFISQTPDFASGTSSVGYYLVEGVPIWGYDLVSPKSQFSVSSYIKIAKKIIDNIHSRGKLPILVGGTGFYIKGIIDGIPTATIPKIKTLRNTLAFKSREELYEMLAQLDPIKAGYLNTSDKKNPRRLIRAIEIAYWKTKKGNRKKEEVYDKFDTLFVGLFLPKDVLNERIAKRVKVRVDQGIEEEIRQLLGMGVGWKSQAMDSLGYREWRDFLLGAKSINDVINEWEKNEKNYAKRQMTWFKKDKRIFWVDASKSELFKSVEKLVSKWHNG